MNRLILILLLLSPYTYAAPIVTSNVPSTNIPIDPLTLSIRTVWGPDIKTVKDAVHWIIEPIGYRLVTSYPAPKESATMAQSTLPPAIKMHRTMAILDALQLLIGTENTVIIDKRNHLISFQKGIIK